MALSQFPEIGAQARRKADGILGEICASNPHQNRLIVRWPTVPGAYARQECTGEQFNRNWELTGGHIPPPRETGFAPGLIAGLVIAFFLFVVARTIGPPYTPYAPSTKPISADSPATLMNAKALYGKYGLLAEAGCAAGADEYLRSIAPHRFNWSATGMLESKFDKYSPAVTTPGILTLISDKANVSNGFSVFHPIELVCNYDTQNREVVSYSAHMDAQ